MQTCELKLHEAILIWMNQPTNRFHDHTCDTVAGWINAHKMFEDGEFHHPVTPQMVNACFSGFSPRSRNPEHHYFGGNFCKLSTPWRLRRWCITALGSVHAHELLDALGTRTSGPAS